jgi:hypothetical protein
MIIKQELFIKGVATGTLAQLRHPDHNEGVYETALQNYQMFNKM